MSYVIVGAFCEKERKGRIGGGWISSGILEKWKQT
jgi:hypothetical protein